MLLRKPTIRETLLLLVLTAVAVYALLDSPHPDWMHERLGETTHYKIYSSATVEQTREIGVLAEEIYRVYGSFMEEMEIRPKSHGKLEMLLFKDKAEFKAVNNQVDWAEGFYLEPYCYQYYSAKEKNPWHWMIHEATHQLNNEVAGLDLEIWLEEGIADYFGTSQIVDGTLQPGTTDRHTYPVWWVHKLARTGDREQDIRNGSFLPLKVILTDQGGPDRDTAFNLYYLHWWTLFHFLMEGHERQYRAALPALLKAGGRPEAFEKLIGPLPEIEEQWYQHSRGLRAAFRKTGAL